jgi:hypothetical protein
MERQTSQLAALVRASLESLVMGAMLAGCAGDRALGPDASSSAHVDASADTSPDAGVADAPVTLPSARAWTREGRGLYWMLDHRPIGMSRNGQRVLEDDGSLWSAADASATVVHSVDDPVALSGDGQAVVARLDGGGSPCATLARWTAAGLEPVAPHGAPGAVQAEGGVVVGTAAFGCETVETERAFVWNGNGAMIVEPLSADDDRTEALALSADGATLIGFSSSTSTLHGRLFSWTTSDGARQLEETRIGTPGHGAFVSDDGRVVAGTTVDDVGVASAFVWSAAAGAGLKVLPRLASRSGTYVLGLSADGAVVLALATDGDDGLAFTWSAAAGPELLEGPNGTLEVDALVMSADASSIVGAPVGDDGAPVAWDAQRAPTRVFGDAPVFSKACRPLVTSLAADGKTLAGACNAPDGPRGFVARLP